MDLSFMNKFIGPFVTPAGRLLFVLLLGLLAFVPALLIKVSCH